MIESAKGRTAHMLGVALMEQLDSPQIREAARLYADAAHRHDTAPFWRRKTASLELKQQRRAYVRALIATAEARRIEQA